MSVYEQRDIIHRLRAKVYEASGKTADVARSFGAGGAGQGT
jgi:hypothetical protein